MLVKLLEFHVSESQIHNPFCVHDAILSRKASPALDTAHVDRAYCTTSRLLRHRIRQTRVLVVGVEALMIETCKNLVLAGVQAVTLLDHRSVTVHDLAANFFINSTDIGKNV